MHAPFLALGLSLALAAPLGADGLTDMTKAERAAFGEAVRSYLLENPDVVVEAMTILQNRQASAEASVTAIFANGPSCWSRLCVP